MQSGIKTQYTYPDGSLSPVFEYVPDYFWHRLAPGTPLFKMPIRDMKEPGVWITYPDGVRIFRPNSYYSHIEPLTPTLKDIL